MEFDLYDYEPKKMVCDTSDTGYSIGGTGYSMEDPGDFSFSELAPKKLFDSKDTIINFADDILDEVKQPPPPQNTNTFGTPVILRRRDHGTR